MTLPVEERCEAWFEVGLQMFRLMLIYKERGKNAETTGHAPYVQAVRPLPEAHCRLGNYSARTLKL